MVSRGISRASLNRGLLPDDAAIRQLLRKALTPSSLWWLGDGAAAAQRRGLHKRYVTIAATVRCIGNCKPCARRCGVSVALGELLQLLPLGCGLRTEQLLRNGEPSQEVRCAAVVRVTLHGFGLLRTHGPSRLCL